MGKLVTLYQSAPSWDTVAQTIYQTLPNLEERGWIQGRCAEKIEFTVASIGEVVRSMQGMVSKVSACVERKIGSYVDIQILEFLARHGDKLFLLIGPQCKILLVLQGIRWLTKFMQYRPTSDFRKNTEDFSPLSSSK